MTAATRSLPSRVGLPLRYVRDLRPLTAIPLDAIFASLHTPLRGSPPAPRPCRRRLRGTLLVQTGDGGKECPPPAGIECPPPVAQGVLRDQGRTVMSAGSRTTISGRPL